MTAPRRALVTLIASALAWPALAQPPATPRAPVQIVMPLLVDPASRPAPSQRPAPALADSQLDRLGAARRLRESGLTDRARQALAPLLAKAPHHPLVLGEIAALHTAREEWTAIERLARFERAAQRDSLLLGQELVLALERLGRPRQAAQIALECWIVRPTEYDWAFQVISRLAAADQRGVRDAVRRVAEAFPNRVDLRLGHARLEWRTGDDRGALLALQAADRPGITPPLRWTFAEELLRAQTSRDSSGALEALLAMARDPRFDATLRVQAARRAWELHRVRASERAGAPALYQALRDLPPGRWHGELLVGVARGLREAGLTTEARGLLEAPGLKGAQQPQVALERALADLRDGPPARALTGLAGLAAAATASPEVTFQYAEALFFAGLFDSALAVYKRSSQDPSGPYTGAALERMFLIEDADPRAALPAYAQLAYREWRGDDKGTVALADSLYRNLPRGTLWAQVAVFLSARRQVAGEAEAALEPLLALAEGQPGDRLAPLARQRAGDLYLFHLKDETRALAQYEECLIRYPRGWNAAEVRRRVDMLRRRRL